MIMYIYVSNYSFLHHYYDEFIQIFYQFHIYVIFPFYRTYLINLKELKQKMILKILLILENVIPSIKIFKPNIIFWTKPPDNIIAKAVRTNAEKSPTSSNTSVRTRASNHTNVKFAKRNFPPLLVSTATNASTAENDLINVRFAIPLSPRVRR